jgi:hypothetical protein
MTVASTIDNERRAVDSALCPSLPSGSAHRPTTASTRAPQIAINRCGRRPPRRRDAEAKKVVSLTHTTRSLGQQPLRVIHYRSLRDENRSMSAMPRKRRLAVKASSVAMGQEETFARVRQATSSIFSRPSKPRYARRIPVGGSLRCWGNLVHRIPQFDLVAVACVCGIRNQKRN